MYVVAGQRVNSTRNFLASSYYPGRGDNSHALASVHQDSIFYAPNVDDDGCLSADDPVEDELPAELAQKHPNKFSESLVIEVSL